MDGVPHARVNYTISTGLDYAGYVKDIGDAYGNRNNGFSYGWVVTDSTDPNIQKGTCRDRNDTSAPLPIDERYDSLNHLQKRSASGAVWEIAVPNGTYYVHVVGGDIQNTDDNIGYIFEDGTANELATGLTPVRKVPNETAGDGGPLQWRFVEYYVTVTVTDGKLSIVSDYKSPKPDPDPNTGTNGNNKITYIDINTVPPAKTPLVVTGVATSDIYYITLVGTDVKVFTTLDGSGAAIASRALSSISTFTVNTSGGDDTIIGDFAAGNFIPTGGMTIDAGADNDTIKVKGIDLTGKDVIVGNTQLKLGDQIIAISGVETVAVDAGASGVVNVKSLLVGNQTSLDLAKGTLVISKTAGTTAAEVFSMLKSGRADGAWDGPGLMSSAAAARTDGFTGLTLAEDANNIVVKYSWNGDVNQDGFVNADDYFAVDSGYITQVGGYANGDLNFDGLVNADDYFLIDSAYIGQSSGLSADQDVLAIAQPQKKDAAPSVLSQLFSTVPVL
jgi:hypothetical protein